MATLKDIANELNFSVPLISKVLSGNMGTTICSDETRLAILAKAKELNYHPNSRARALSLGRSGTIGVFIHSIGLPGSESLYKQLLEGITQQANIDVLRLCLSFYETDSQFMQSFSQVAKNEIDGLIVAGVHHPNLQKVYEDLKSKGTPVVSVFRDGTPHQNDVNVCCDELQVGYLPTLHLLEKGCRRIAHIRCLDKRYQGYLKALEDHNIAIDPALIFQTECDLTVSTGKRAVQQWIKQGIEIDGLVAESDHQAFGAINELLLQGKRVPEDVKVIGVDNSPICELSPVTISSVKAPMNCMGRKAVQCLLKQIHHQEVSSHSFPPRLHLRASC
ncbi:LacI family DNA-binding transcriptional regulator [Kiritimatiellaeota bacterium B1221]|nr:LacI family DNA-binding transcriptional regulator [Kiritimatiellaeota bacterium B1221]